MTKKKTAAAPSRAKARAAEKSARTRGGVAPKPAATSVARQHQERKDLESARTRGQARRFNKNLTALDSDVSKRNAVKVRATQVGYYDHLRRRPGDVFLIRGDRLEADEIRVNQDTGEETVKRKKGELIDFSEKWMELVDPRTPESISTANDNIRQQHDELLASRYADGIQTGPDNVPDDIEDDHSNPLGE